MQNISIKEKIKKWINSILDFATIVINIVFLFSFLGLILFIFYIWSPEKTDRVLKFLEITSWPIFALFFVLLFKSNISKLIDNIKKGKFFGNEFERETLIAQQKEIGNVEIDKKLLVENKKEIIAGNSEIEKVKSDLAISQIHLDFERIYNVIFGSQILFLDLLKKYENGLASDFFNSIFFPDIKKKFKPTFNKWSEFDYLKYIFSSGLIAFDRGTYKITEKGIAFLKYVEILGYPKIKNL